MAQLAEAGGLNPPKYGFKSHWGHGLQEARAEAPASGVGFPRARSTRTVIDVPHGPHPTA